MAAPLMLAPPEANRTPAAAATPSASGSPVPAAPEDAVTRKLKAALAESQSRLGALEPWQKKIFDEEAIPQYQRFVRNYRSAQTHSGSAVSNLEVDIDMESLKNYLRFYGPKSTGRTEADTTVLMYLRSDDSCEKCVAAGPGIRKLAAARVLRRGLKPVWVDADDVASVAGAEELKGKALDEKVAAMAAERNAAASLVMQWAPAPVDDIDTAHADEKRFIVTSNLQVRGLAGTGKQPADAQAVAKAESKAEILEVDSFETSAAKILSDAFTDIGAQAQKFELAQASKALQTGDQAEIDLEVRGVSEFAQLAQLKAQVQAKLAGATVEERKIARGHAVLAITGEKSADAIRVKLKGVALDSGRLVPVGDAVASAQSIAMEIRP
jgi:hypothetical protein